MKNIAKPVKIGPAEFAELEKMLLSIGYQEMIFKNSSSFAREFYRRVHRHFSQKLAETGFVYYKEGMRYKSIVWTSFVKTLNNFRGTGLDIIHEIIVDTTKDKIAYCSKPYRRDAKEVILRVARRAWVNQYKITNIPKCRECGEEMQIDQNFDTNQTRYICRNSINHKERKFIFESWDKNLQEKAKNFVKEERGSGEKYRAKNKKEGKTPTPRRKKRRVWVKGPRIKREKPKRE